MPALTASQLANLRSNGHKARFYLSISHPRTLLAATIDNPAIAQGDRTIAYDNGTGSGFGAIADGQVLKVSISSGARKLRVQSIGGNQFAGSVGVAKHSAFLADNQSFDILEDYPLVPRPPLFTASTFYKDWSVIYPGGGIKPVIIAGPHRAKFLSSGSAVFDVDLTNSYAVAQGATMTAASYSATVTPSTGVTVSLTNGVGTITFTNAGQYWVEFSGTDSNGKTQITKRRYWVHDPDPDSSDYPYADFTVETLSGDWERGGWNLGITVNGVAGDDTFPDEALVCLWYVVDYGGNAVYIGGPQYAEQVLFCGYIRQGTVTADWNNSTVQFEAETIQALLRNISMRDVVLEAVSSPAEWYQYDASLTTGRALRHYWGEHSTLFECCDVIGLLDDTTLRASANFQKGDLYSQAESVAREYGINAHAVCNKAGQLHLAQDLQLLPDAERAAAPVTCDLTAQDRQGQITFIDRPHRTAAMVFSNGFAFAGTFTGGVPDVSAYCSKAPGEVPETDGVNFVDRPNQITTSQTRLNQVTGRDLAVENSDEPEARIEFDGIWAGVLDVVGDEWFTMSLAEEDTSRGIVWTNRRLVCRTVDVRIDPVNGYIGSSGVLMPEAPGPAGVTDTCPGFPTTIEADAPEWTPPAASAAATYGYFQGGTTTSDVAERFNFSTQTSAAHSDAYLSTRRRFLPGLSDTTTYGYASGGEVSGGAQSAITDRLTFSTGVAAAYATGDLGTARQEHASLSDGTTYGYSAGGLASAALLDGAERMTLSTGVYTTHSDADLSAGRYRLVGLSDGTTYGYFQGGREVSGMTEVNVATSDRLTFSTGVTAANAGSDLSTARYLPAAVSDGVTYGYICGGFTTTRVATGDRLTFSTSITAAHNDADLSAARREAAGISNNTNYGYICGGDEGAPVATCDRIDFSTGILAAFAGGDLSTSMKEHASMSDGAV